MIPLTTDRIPESTVQSVVSQKYAPYEIILLQNGVIELQGEIEIRECKVAYQENNVPLRKFQIRKKGKGNALNIGIDKASYDLICVLDADCVLDQNALNAAIRRFEDQSVAALGGKIKTANKKKNMLTHLQKIEYMKTFNIARPTFNYFNANCLISGAYGIFRRDDLVLLGGYNTDTVGEDMELVLSIQERLRPCGKKVIYAEDSVCYTRVPSSMIRLLRQRDRWQRGLLDSLLKHKCLIFNLHYGLLGCAALPYQILIELLGPVFNMLTLINLIALSNGWEIWISLFQWIRIINIPQTKILYSVYLFFNMFTTCQAEYLECGKWYVFITKIPEAIETAVFESMLSILLGAARIWGMLSFPWRRLVW